MAKLVFPVLPDGLRVDVLIGLDGATTVAQLAAGQPITAPIRARGEIDTGSNMTAVSAAIRQRLGVPILYQATTQTASGSLAVNVFEVSVGVHDSCDPASPELVESTLSVMELTTRLAGVEVLIGLDFLLGCKLVLDGPVRQFSLES
jgi:hypothetical protein